MVPDAALTAVIARLTAAGLTEARSPLGVKKASQQRIDRGFSVIPLSLGPSTSPGRGRPDVPGLRVEQVFRIELAHRVKPGDGQEAPSQALQDVHAAFKYLSAFGTSLSSGAAIRIGGATHAFEAGGAYMITSFNLSVTYNLTLVI